MKINKKPQFEKKAAQETKVGFILEFLRPNILKIVLTVSVSIALTILELLLFAKTRTFIETANTPYIGGLLYYIGIYIGVCFVLSRLRKEQVSFMIGALRPSILKIGLMIVMTMLTAFFVSLYIKSGFYIITPMTFPPLRLFQPFGIVFSYFNVCIVLALLSKAHISFITDILKPSILKIGFTILILVTISFLVFLFTKPISPLFGFLMIPAHLRVFSPFAIPFFYITACVVLALLSKVHDILAHKSFRT